MNRRAGQGRGVTLPELLVAIAILGIVMVLEAPIFVASQQYFAAGSTQIDAQSAAQTAPLPLVQEIQESNTTGIRINASRNAVLLISARDSTRRFTVYPGPTSQYIGSPHWQKWVVYYLNPQPGSASWLLVRKEGDPFGSGFPRPTIPSPPAGWETTFRAAALPYQVVGRNIQTLDLEDLTCGMSGNPLYLQIISTASNRGVSSSYNPGSPQTFGCAGKTGNWIRVRPRN